MALQGHETNKSHYICTSTVSMATKLARMVIYLVRLIIIKLYKTLTTWSCKVTGQKHPLYISIARVPMANKLGRMMTSLDWLLPINSNDRLFTWPCKIRGSLTEGGSARKRLSRHRFLVYPFTWYILCINKYLSVSYVIKLFTWFFLQTISLI